MKINTVLIVDGTSTAASYAPMFRAYGIPCVHLFSSYSVSQSFGQFINEHDYIECLIHNGDLGSTLSRLSHRNISVILHGMDSALALVDTLSHVLKLEYTNDLALSVSRRHKYEMAETVRKTGLQVPQQLISDNINVISAWAKDKDKFPVIIKPTESAGVKGVFKCNNINEVRKAFDNVMSSMSYYGHPNTTTLIQSYSWGQEYIVDSVSLRGKHKITSLWKVKRDKGEYPFLDYMGTIDHTLPEYKKIRDYAHGVLNSLGVINGPTHLEIINTDTGPVMVELNCRLHGSLDLRLTTYACGRNHVQDVICSLLSPEVFLRQRDDDIVYSGHAIHALLRSPLENRILHKDYWKKMEQLPSFVGYRKNLESGSLTSITKDLKSAVGTLSLFSLDARQLEMDILTIRNDEQRGLMYE